MPDRDRVLSRRTHVLLCFVLMVWLSSIRAAEVDFAKTIQPLLKKHCYECHDARKQRAGLRLDVRELALKGGESGESAIVPGNAGASLLLARVTSEDSAERMPPEGEPLSAEEIEQLSRWIASGATWPDELAGELAAKGHWAFQAPELPPVPAVGNPQWCRTPIDHFVLAKLEHEGLQPSPEADPLTLVRRLYLDLIGLPPTPEQAEQFLNDPSENRYEELVDRLLASPHYGERWGRHWLDAARYADSDGFEKDKSREVWFYRDWVIGALNRDLPYDQFIIQQIAGDLLPNATQDQIVATGFLRNSMINEEGGVDPEQFRMEAMFDRMDAIGKSILGITIQCAQCHTHKYDPITHEEYYQLFAFLNNAHEASTSVYTEKEQEQRERIFGEIRAIEQQLRAQVPDWPQRMANWEEQVRSGQPEWIVVQPQVDDISTGGQKYLPLEDGSFLAQGYAPTKHRVKMTIRTELPKITAFRLELLTDPNLPRGGPGRSVKGTAALTEFEVEAAPASQPDQVQKVQWAEATADLNLPKRPLDPMFDDRSKRERVTGPIEFAIDGNGDTAWGTDAGPGRRNNPRKAVFKAEQPIEHEGGTVLTFYLSQMHGGWNSDDNQNHNLGRFRLSITSTAEAQADPLPQRVRDILAIPREQRTPEQVDEVFSYWRTTVPEWKEANEQIEALWQQHPDGASQLVLLARDKPRTTHLLERGDFLKPARPVEPGVPEFLHPLPEGEPLNRLTFARWLVDRRCPTTARAIVNRIWQAYFGQGLVATSEDLGTQAEPPSHPELFDWLAVQFMDGGWRLKDLHRLIVTSATYRQSSNVDSELLRRDPYNRLLARGPRFRVEAEVVRDVALAASGLLDPRVGGPSVYPPLPDFMLKPPVSYGPKVWYEDHDGDRYRRAIYTFRYRSLPYPMLQTFDAPNGDFSCVRRERSNTPLQALVTLNEPIFVECARALALKTLREGGKDDEQRLEYAFRRCLTRSPDSEEKAELLSLLSKQLERLNEGSLDAWKIASPDAETRPELPDGATPQQLAAWTIVSRVLLNLDEMITKP